MRTVERQNYSIAHLSSALSLFAPSSSPSPGSRRKRKVRLLWVEDPQDSPMRTTEVVTSDSRLAGDAHFPLSTDLHFSSLSRDWKRKRGTKQKCRGKKSGRLECQSRSQVPRRSWDSPPPPPINPSNEETAPFQEGTHQKSDFV